MWIFLTFPTRDFRTVDPEEVVGAPEDPVPVAQLGPAGDLAAIDTGPAKRDRVKDPLVSADPGEMIWQISSTHPPRSRQRGDVELYTGYLDNTVLVLDSDTHQLDICTIRGQLDIRGN